MSEGLAELIRLMSELTEDEKRQLRDSYMTAPDLELQP